jgi:hypothetical protein
VLVLRYVQDLSVDQVIGAPGSSTGTPHSGIAPPDPLPDAGHRHRDEAALQRGQAKALFDTLACGKTFLLFTAPGTTA